MKDLIIKEMNLTGKLMFSRSEVIDMLERYSVKPKVVESCGVIANYDSREIMCNEQTLKLPRKEFLLIHYFITNKNRVINRTKLLADIWGTDIIVGDRTIDVHIRKIRRAIPTMPIKTIKGVGYMWND
jgi:two-component system alkaline phosphatase synthesis response regulator PhoP